MNCSIVKKIGDYSLSKNNLHVFTGFNWENIIKIREILTLLKNSTSRTSTQAIVTFLFKPRRRNSSKVIASVLGLEQKQQVFDFSDSVINSFMKDVLQFKFGFHAPFQQELIKNEKSEIAKKLYNIKNNLALIFDGTYVHHEKSSNNEYQRRSYCEQKKKSLCKPFTIVTTNGCIVETLGPFSANLNDASIMEEILQDTEGLQKILKPGNVLIVDHSFCDVKDKLEKKGNTISFFGFFW